MQSLSVWYVNNCWFISQILLGSCVHSLDFRYYGLVRKYYTMHDLFYIYITYTTRYQ